MKQNGSFSSAILPDALLFWHTEMCCVARISRGRPIRFLSPQRFPLLHQVQHIFSLFETKKNLTQTCCKHCSFLQHPLQSLQQLPASCHFLYFLFVFFWDFEGQLPSIVSWFCHNLKGTRLLS